MREPNSERSRDGEHKRPPDAEIAGLYHPREHVEQAERDGDVEPVLLHLGRVPDERLHRREQDECDEECKGLEHLARDEIEEHERGQSDEQREEPQGELAVAEDVQGKPLRPEEPDGSALVVVERLEQRAVRPGHQVDREI